MLEEKIVAIASLDECSGYPNQIPFRPHQNYPELNGHVPIGNEINTVYPLFRQLLKLMDLDSEHYSTPNWNPFVKIIQPGYKVLIKPNLVRHLHMAGGNYDSVVTHASIVRCALDYVALALKGQGEIIVGDAPVQGADFNVILERTGLQDVCEDIEKIWQIPVRLSDFRLWSMRLDKTHTVISAKALNGDAAGYVSVSIDEHSMLTPLNSHHDKFRVPCYDCREMVKHHNETRHEYLIPRAVLESDVVINLPKLKTHRKVGLTAALKNMVGINGHKDWLPHYRLGSIERGGDEYQHKSISKSLTSKLDEKLYQEHHSFLNPFRKLAIRGLKRISYFAARDFYSEGSWYGNDTAWRMVLDLNRILLYANSKGRLEKERQRTCISVVDAIIAGEGEGPMEPDPRHCGLLVGGGNPVAIDSVLSTLVGFDYTKIPLINNAFYIKTWPINNIRPNEISVRSNDMRFTKIKVGKPFYDFRFTPPSGWIGNVELF